MITPSEPNVVVAQLCQAGRNLAFAGREAICHQREAISNMRKPDSQEEAGADSLAACQ